MFPLMTATELKETTRLEFFSDGVFAIAITLLGIELKVPPLPPEAGGRDLAAALLARWPGYMAFVLSFLTILVMWVNHHRMFRHVRGGDGYLMLTNGLLLMLVTAVPLPTAILAEHFLHPSAGAACAAYAGFYVLVNAAFNLVWWSIAYRRRLLAPDVPDAVVRAIGRRLAVGLPAYLVVAGVAFMNAWLGLALCALLWVHWTQLDATSVEKPPA
ncbi:MAG: DUF1211 domain-containing protein [Gemmataceae bacterium]|nr:DUF1211 domain-containing protein [Gemmataceae bacterium]